MNKYETIFIMKDDITEEQRNNTINKVKKYLNENGKITNTDNKGLMKLAYAIKNHKQGYYYAINFMASSQSINELERIYRITDEILRFITIKEN